MYPIPAKVRKGRASDTIQHHDIEKSGFIVRKRTPARQALRYFALLIVIIIGVAVLTYYDSLTACGLAVVAGVVLLLIGKQLEKVEKNQRAAEFMNALFSNALSKDYRFCLVARTDGGIIYFNRTFQEMFPAFIAQAKRDMETLLSLYHVTPEHRGTIATQLIQSTPATLAVIIQSGSDQAPQPLILSMEPIERPRGFVLDRKSVV